MKQSIYTGYCRWLRSKKKNSSLLLIDRQDDGFLFIWLPCCHDYMAHIVRSKGCEGVAAFFAGLIFGILAVVYYAILPKTELKQEEDCRTEFENEEKTEVMREQFYSEKENDRQLKDLTDTLENK